jgi:hypothetical protein
MIAKKAEIKDYKLKVLIWGKPGVGKSRWALNSDKPLVIDFENSTTLYSNEFDFYRAAVDHSTAAKSKKDSNVKDISNATLLTTEIIKEISDGVYNNIVNTLIIDSATDLLDNIESILLNQYEKKIGKNLMQLNQLQKSKWYAFRRDNTRRLLDKIIALDVNIIFTARSKIVWGTGSDGKTQPVGTQVDALEILESLVDVVIEITEDRNINIVKTRLSKSDGIIEGIKTFNDFKQFVINDKTKKDDTMSAKREAGKRKDNQETPAEKDNTDYVKSLRVYQKKLKITDNKLNKIIKEVTNKDEIDELNEAQVNEVYAKLIEIEEEQKSNGK